MTQRRWNRHRPIFAQPVPRAVRAPKIKWKILPIIWLATKRMATVIGFLVILNAIIALFVLPSLMRSQGAPNLPDKMVLFLEFEDGLAEIPPRANLADAFAPAQPTVQNIVEGLDRAATDPRVKGLIARMDSGSFNMAHVYEIRAALKRFRSAGKFAYIYSPSYGEGGGGLGRYYLASAFSQIWMQPLGVVSIAGVSVEIPYLRGTLDKIGVTPQFFKRKDYKTAYESLTNKTISKPNAEMMQEIVDDIRAEILSSIPVERGLDPKQFENLVEKGLLTGPEALEAGLITRYDYGDVMLSDIAEFINGVRDPESINLVNLAGYAGAAPHKLSVPLHKKPKVAMVRVVGAIMPSAEGGGLAGGNVAAADEIAPAIYNASLDDGVEAIVVRIDSPGGSPSASETILHAIENAKKKGKLVVVSMGPTAASGGYWVAAYADRIFAAPTTLTGSIGVVGGKFATQDLSAKLGVNWETVSWGQNAGIWSMNTPFNPSEAERINVMLDDVYASFIERVAMGRNMSVEAVDKIAGGRVWTGRRAVQIGLVDEIGGLESALDYTAQALGQRDRHDLNVIEVPEPKTALEKILQLLGNQVAMGPQWLHDVQVQLQPFLQIIALQQNPQDFLTYEPLKLR